MNNEKNLVKGLVISAAIIGGSILINGALGFLSHGHKKPHPHAHNTCCERRIPSNHEHFKKDSKTPPCHMKNPEFNGDKKEGKSENNECKPTNDNQRKPQV